LVLIVFSTWEAEKWLQKMIEDVFLRKSFKGERKEKSRQTS